MPTESMISIDMSGYVDVSSGIESLGPSIKEMSIEANREIGKNIIEGIKLRTKSGVDVNYVPFVPYANGKSPVTLKKTGKMLNAIVYEPTGEDSGKVIIKGNEGFIASLHNAGVRGRLPMRQFFGASQSDESEAVDHVSKETDAIIKDI